MKILALFTFSRFEDMMRKGNMWYVRHYELYFDRVYVIHLHGIKPACLVQDGTTIVCLGNGSVIVNIFLAPWRLFLFCRKIAPTAYLTAELVYSWWISLFVKIFLRARVTLMPVCKPDVIYFTSGRSMSRLPIPLEKVLIDLSFWMADQVLIADANPKFLLDWLSRKRGARKKIQAIGAGVEDLPTQEFFESLKTTRRRDLVASSSRPGFKLVYVGRLSREKLVADLIEMMAVLRGQFVTLSVIGWGDMKEELQAMAIEKNVSDAITFVGRVENKDLPTWLFEADAFVSPLTGTALREAALCGLPIVAYDMDWVSGFFQHDKTALLAPPKDFLELASQVRRLMADDGLRARLSKNVEELARQHYLPERVGENLKLAFDDRVRRD